MQRVWLAVLLLGLGAIGAAVAAAASQPARVSAIAAAPQPSPTATPDPGGANGQAFKDGCTRDPSSLIDGLAPEWAYVYNTPPDQPPPPPRWVVGTVSAYNKAFVPVHISGGDLPSGHDAYDYNVNIAPDSPYTYLVGGHPATVTSPATGNYPGNDESTARLHTEWEDDAIPKFAWAQDGDRLTELGNWVWDCGHWGTPTQIFSPDYVLPKVGQPCLGTLVEIDSVFDPAQCTISGESTEFHPYRALWDVRAQPNSPEGESEAELFVSTHATRAGIIAACAHKNPPVNALPNTALRACVQTDPDWQDVSGDYSFFLAAPPPPSATAHLIYRAIDRGSTGGAPAPTLTAKGNGVQVDFHLATTPGQQQQLAYQVFAGWDQLAAAAVPTHLHVTFERLTVHRAMDPGCSLT